MNMCLEGRKIHIWSKVSDASPDNRPENVLKTFWLIAFIIPQMTLNIKVNQLIFKYGPEGSKNTHLVQI